MDQEVQDNQSPSQLSPEAPVVTPDVTPNTAPVVPESTPAEPVAPVEPEQYVADMSYKYLDETRTIDDRFAPILKSKEDEDLIRELYQKSDGLERQKERSKYFETQHAELQKNYQSVYNTSEANAAETARLAEMAKKDLRSFARLQGIDEESILQAAAGIIEEQENPELARQSQLLYEQRQAQYQSETEAAQLRKEVAQMRSHQHVQSFNSAMQGQYAGQKQQVDSILGQGAFEREVALTGESLSRQQGRTLSVDEAVNATLQRFGSLMQTATPAPTAPVQPTQQQAAPAAPANLGSGTQGAAPIKKRFSTLGEMKAEGDRLKAVRMQQEIAKYS
jgi:hypothetical protein